MDSQPHSLDIPSCADHTAAVTTNTPQLTLTFTIWYVYFPSRLLMMKWQASSASVEMTSTSNESKVNRGESRSRPVETSRILRSVSRRLLFTLLGLLRVVLDRMSLTPVLLLPFAFLRSTRTGSQSKETSQWQQCLWTELSPFVHFYSSSSTPG